MSEVPLYNVRIQIQDQRHPPKALMLAHGSPGGSERQGRDTGPGRQGLRERRRPALVASWLSCCMPP